MTVPARGLFLRYLLTDSSVGYIFNHMKGSNVAAHKGTEEMKKGQIVKCVESNYSYLTVGKNYAVTSGQGDYGKYGKVHTVWGFEIVADNNQVIFAMNDNKSAHGKFEVVS